MQTKKFSGIVVFGDGLSDMGQWGKLTDFKYPPASVGFLESRWTNGKTWAELFAEKLNLPLTLKNNYAIGGATTGLYNINEALKPLLQLDSSVVLRGMLGQVQHHLSQNPTIDENTLCVLWAGGHDIGNYLDYGQPDLKSYPPIHHYKQAVELLTKAGAKHIMLSTMPDMGFSPGYMGTEKQQPASELCAQLNEGLHNLAKEYHNSDVKLYLFDGAGVFAKIGSNPDAYGIKYTDAYLPWDIIDFTNPLAAPSKTIENQDKGLSPDEFMNWWAVSASAKVHQIIAEEAYIFLTQ
jgi:phospholipase/lecithinase/hemolysin